VVPASPCDEHYYQEIDVSVVIPFFNPAANIEDCLASMLNQTLDPSRFEVVLVDDGSTDGSPGRVDEWVARHPELFAVHRIPASGWPGRPRNVGMDRSRGRYIQFVDSDDSLAPRALERLLEVADESDADVVVGKISSDFRGINHALFRTTVTRRTLADYPIVHNLTVCKLFRRDFLLAHDVRFAEGPRHVEDQHICIQAYVHAKSVAVVGDTACYFYRRRRTGGRNLGDTLLVPSEYYRDLGFVLDVSDSPITAPAGRANVQQRLYRTEMLGRLRGPAMLGYDADYRREMVSEVRRLATTRIPPEVHDSLPTVLRAQSRLLLDDDVDGLLEFGRRLEMIRLRAVTATPRWEDGRLVVGIDAQLCISDEPFRLERTGDAWMLPKSMAPSVDAADRRLGPGDESDLDLDLATISRRDSQSWSTTDGLTLEIDGDGCPRVRGEVRLDPWSLIGGTTLTPGRWDLRLRVSFAGLRRTAPVRPMVDPPPGLDAWVSADTDELHSVAAYWTKPSPTLALDVDEWAHSLHDLLDDPSAAPPRIDARRRLVITTSRIKGPPRAAGHTQLILEPTEAPELGLMTCDAELQIRPDGTTIQARIPRLPPHSPSWAVWLRIGEVGGPPPRRLPITISQGRLRRLSVSDN
jgi:hypothetical protein